MLRVGELERMPAGRRYEESRIPELVGHIRFDWDALDAWFEEDEQVFVHPRNPYVRVDALRSSRRLRVEKDGVVLADSPAPVMVFETGLPTRCYVDRSAVDFSRLVPSQTVTACPYKGRTTGYWSVRDRRRRVIRISPGPTTSQPGSCSRSRDSWPSTTSRSTSSSTASRQPRPTTHFSN